LLHTTQHEEERSYLKALSKTKQEFSLMIPKDTTARSFTLTASTIYIAL
jgi:hypothetical protein